MRTRTVCIGVGCLLLGVVASAVMPSLRAQAVTTCVPEWKVEVGAERGADSENSGWHAVKWNPCTGEAFIFSAPNHNKPSPEQAKFIPAQ